MTTTVVAIREQMPYESEARVEERAPAELGIRAAIPLSAVALRLSSNVRDSHDTATR